VSEVKVGDHLEVEIERPIYRGLGLAHHEGQAVLVARGLPGERARVEVEASHRSYLRARVETVLDPAPGRRVSPCGAFPACGGCAYQELEYADQIVAKRAVVLDALGRSPISLPADLQVVPSPERGWRCRVDLHVEETGGEARIGLRGLGSHRLVSFDECLQLSESSNRTIGELRRALAGAGRAASDVRRVRLLEDTGGAERVVGLSTNRNADIAAPLRASIADLEGVVGVGVVTPGRGADRFQLLHGRAFVTMRVGEHAYRTHVESFFQANRHLTEALVADVVERVPEGRPVLDLFGGVGLFSLPLAGKSESVTNVESSRFAVSDARANAKAAGAANLSVRRGAVADVLGGLKPRSGECVLADPPRGGLGRRLIEPLVAREPERIVYVSCDPPALARDLKLFADAGYRADGLSCFDLFPDTFHVETVCQLSRST